MRTDYTMSLHALSTIHNRMLYAKFGVLLLGFTMLTAAEITRALCQWRRWKFVYYYCGSI